MQTQTLYVLQGWADLSDHKQFIVFPKTVSMH